MLKAVFICIIAVLIVSSNASANVVGLWLFDEGNGDTVRRQYQIGVIDADGTARFYVSHTGTDHQRPIGEGVPANKWTHLAGTFDGQTIRVFVNGVLSAELESTGVINQSEIEFLIGGYGPDAEYATNRHFNGIIDEVRVSDVALKADEIKRSMEGFAAVSPDRHLSTTWANIKAIKLE